MRQKSARDMTFYQNVQKVRVTSVVSGQQLLLF